MTTTITTSFEIDDITVSIGDRLVIEGEIFTVTRIAGRWVSISNGSNISRAAAADARAEYLEDEETLGEEIEDTEFDDVEIEEDEAAEDEAAESHDIVRPEYRQIYRRSVSDNGNRTYDTGDELAGHLRGQPLEVVLNLCNALMPEKIGRWDHLNIGQRSMNARNAIRHSIKKGVFAADFVMKLACRISLRA